MWDRDVCWEKLVIDSESGEKVVLNLADIARYPTSVENVWLGLGLVGINHNTGAGAAAVGRNY